MNEFLVHIVTTIPDGTPAEEVAVRRAAEAERVAELSQAGRVVRLWRTEDGRDTIGLCRAFSDIDLRTGVLDTLPLREWMAVAVTSLAPHPNDPAAPERPLGHRTAGGLPGDAR
jgi:muconolactone D-isomerase